MHHDSDDTSCVPSLLEREELRKVGLGTRKITFDGDGGFEHLQETLYRHYPKLADGGGFIIYRNMHAGGKLLTTLPMPSSGYSVPYFRDESVLKHAVAYVRPLQKNMQIDHSASSAHCEEERESKAAKVSCVNCGKEVTIGCLENHQKVCNVDVDNLSISEVRTNLTLNQTLELLTWRYQTLYP
ncbi:uncharacterized protein LOC144442195 [Glandiceps talaboti]